MPNGTYNSAQARSTIRSERVLLGEDLDVARLILLPVAMVADKEPVHVLLDELANGIEAAQMLCGRVGSSMHVIDTCPP